MTKRVYLSYGFGVESTRILQRWIDDPSSRDFALEDLVVISAQLGDEHNDTIADVEKYILPMLAWNRIRFVEIARASAAEADGIIILQDSRAPKILNPRGERIYDGKKYYRLSDELRGSGVVPQSGSEHRCAMKFKGWPIEKWLDGEAAGEIRHAFGYNAEETKRVAKSEAGFAARMAFGFNSGETKRANRAATYDGPKRIGFYPLIDWGETREDCIAGLRDRFGIAWKKSACVFCPFNAECSKGTDAGLDRLAEHPAEAVDALIIEYAALAMNPRAGALYSRKTLAVVVESPRTAEIRGLFAEKLEACEWALYRIRRIYKAKTLADRSVEIAAKGSREKIEAAFFAAAGSDVETIRGIKYDYRRRRNGVKGREEFFVAAPAIVNPKVRHAASFELNWMKE